MSPLEGVCTLGGEQKDYDWIDLTSHELVVAAISTPVSPRRLLELANAQIEAAKELGDHGSAIAYTNAKCVLSALVEKPAS